MTLNKKVANYKVLDLVILYNFGIKFDFIRDHMKKLWFISREIIFRGWSYHRPLLKIIFTGLSLEMHFQRRVNCYNSSVPLICRSGLPFDPPLKKTEHSYESFSVPWEGKKPKRPRDRWCCILASFCFFLLASFCCFGGQATTLGVSWRLQFEYWMGRTSPCRSLQCMPVSAENCY